jgi:glycosyltransferase involved in cell wall biosynthesis
LRALHVIAGLDPAHGGPSYSVPRLCAELAAQGVDVDLLYVAGASPPALAGAPGYRLHGYPQTWARTPGLGALRLSSGLRQRLAGLARSADVIHGHGIWLAPNLATATQARRAGKPFVCSPRGMLSRAALAFSPGRKRVVWALGQRAALAGAAALHATSESERDEIRAAGLAAPVAVIPNGVDIPEAPPPRPAGGPHTALSLGRIHPKKGLDTLLAAWARVETDHPQWRLRIVGPAEDGHDAELRAFAGSLGLQRVTIEGPVWGAEKAALYAASELFVAPTRSENFGLTVAEALAAAMPAICTTGAPWSELQSEQCGWWVDQGPDALTLALSDALGRPTADLATMGDRGRALVARRYGWARVAEDMAALYGWLVAGGDRPAFVHLD